MSDLPLCSDLGAEPPPRNFEDRSAESCCAEGTVLPERGPFVGLPAQPAVSERRVSGALGQTVFFLVALVSMLGSARFVMPTIVEEVRYAWYRGELRARHEASGDGLKNVSLGALSEAYQMVTQHVGPSVVHIDVSRDAPEAQARNTNLLGSHPSESFDLLADQGSGVVIDVEGFVMTNYHVIAEGSKITVGLSDGRRFPARVIGTDPLTDLALLKIDADRLIPMRWGDSDQCLVGSPVWAVGSPFGLDRTVTFGILSGKHRVVKASSHYQDFMQSDAAVNPGNSGGPLVDANGELVGINTAIVGDTFRGVSFSIPSNVAKEVYRRLKANGRFDRGWLGITLEEVPDELVFGDDFLTRGALVTGFAGIDSPAARDGVQVGDIILRLDQATIKDMGHLMRVAGNLVAGKRIVLDLLRGNERLAIEMTIGDRPEHLRTR